MFQKLGILKEDERKFLLKHPCDTQEKLDAYQHLPIKFRFDKQRTGWAYLMISKLDKKFRWVVYIKVTKNFKTGFKPLKLWSKANFQIAENAAVNFLSEVGITEDGEPKFENYEHTLLYSKLLTDEELNELENLVEIDDTSVSGVIH